MTNDNSEGFDKDFQNFEKQRELASAMVQFKTIFDAAVAAGFSESQAVRIISDMLLSGNR